MKEIVSRVTLMKNMPGTLFPEWSESDTKLLQNKAHKPNCGDERRHAGHILLPLSMLVSRLQNSASIRSALPPEEYFQLIHQICRVMQRSLQHYGGIQCARGAEAMAGYFLKHNEGSYRMNAVSCALEIKARMSQLNRQWKLRKKWLIDMFLNIGIQEGKEYSGPDHISSDIGFLPFGDIFCVAKRLSEIARDGSILTTKTLLIHLEKIELDQLRYGILQKQGERQVWVEKAYAPITHWIPCANIAPYEMEDTAAISVAEVLNFR